MPGWSGFVTGKLDVLRVRKGNCRVLREMQEMLDNLKGQGAESRLWHWERCASQL